MKAIHRTIGAALLSAALFAGCGGNPHAPASHLLAHADQVVRAASPAQSVQVRVSPPEVRHGQRIALDLASNTPGYLYIYQISTDGQTLSLLFPNAMDGANYVTGPLQLPRGQWTMTARGPAGVGYMLAVLTAQPQDLLVLGEQARSGRVALSGPYAASMAQLRELP